jgi:uncharacterized membrane protein
VRLTPVPGAVGTTTISIVASDGLFQSTNTFTLFVEEPPDYTLIELPNLPGSEGTTVADINDNGLVVGTADLPGFAERAVVWDTRTTPPTISSISAPNSSFASSINNAGQIVGGTYNITNNAFEGRGFIFDNGTYTSLPLDNSQASFAWQINDNGAIAGGLFSSKQVVYREGSPN